MGKSKTKNSPSTFDTAFTKLGFSDPEEAVKIDNLDDMHDNEDVTKIKDDDQESIEKPEDNKKDSPIAWDDLNEDKTAKETDPNAHDDDTDIPDEVLDNNTEKNEKDQELDDETTEDEEETEEENSDEVDSSEAAGVAAFFDAIADSEGWDVSDEDKPKTVEDFIQYIHDTVEENSKPEYANEQIKQLDEYVKNGGNFADFYQNMSQTVSYDNLDLEDESDQKVAIRDYLKLSGYNDEQINKKIERYEDADMLQDEATDAAEKLKEYKAAELDQQQKMQEQQRMMQEERAQAFYSELTNTVNSLNSIRGIQVPKQDRKALLDYICKTDADGKTQYEKDYAQNTIKNLIDSAYFTMKGDTLLGEAKRSGETQATQKLRKLLRHQSKNHSTYNASEEKQTQAWDIASRYL